MTPPPTTSEPAAADPCIADCLSVVRTLTEVGLALVRSLDPAAGPAPVADPYLAYCRVARALRLTVLLERRLAALAAGGAEALAAEAALDKAVVAETDTDATETPERPETENLRPARDREAPDEVLRYLKRPLIDLVTAICRGYALSPEATADAKAPFLALAANDDPPPPPRPENHRPAPPAPAPGGPIPARERRRALGP
jgi:hypothetical protein